VSKAYVLVTRGSEELFPNIYWNTDGKLFICSKQPYGHRSIYRGIVIGAEDTRTTELIATYLQQKAGISPEDCEDFQIFEAKSQNELTTEEIALTPPGLRCGFHQSGRTGNKLHRLVDNSK